MKAPETSTTHPKWHTPNKATPSNPSQTSPSENCALKYRSYRGHAHSNHHNITQSFSILTSQTKRKSSTRLLQLKMLVQLWKKAPTMAMFLPHNNLALPPMDWILGRWKIRSIKKEHQSCLNVCIALPANHFLAKPKLEEQSTQEPSPIPNMEFAICSKTKKLGKVVHVYNPNAQKLKVNLKVQSKTVKPKVPFSVAMNTHEGCTHPPPHYTHSSIWWALMSLFLNLPVGRCSLNIHNLFQVTQKEINCNTNSSNLWKVRILILFPFATWLVFKFKSIPSTQVSEQWWHTL